MPPLNIRREHHLPLEAAQGVAKLWASYAQTKFDATCKPPAEAEGVTTIEFSHPTVKGTISVDAVAITIDAKLGFMATPFMAKIKAEVAERLDGSIADAAEDLNKAG